MNACFMASAWGYIKRQPGVVAVGSGPGMTNTVTPMYVATTSGMPLTVLGGSFHAPLSGLGGFQEADQMAFARPATKWLAQAHVTREIPHLLHLALGQSVTGRPGATYVDLPNNVLQGKVDESRTRYRNQPLRVDKPRPSPDAIDRLADLLANAKRPLLILGKGAAWSDAGPAIQKLVDRGVPYVTSPMARGTLPDDQPAFMNAARSAALGGADAILMLGGRFNWIFGSGAPERLAPDVRLAQVDLVEEEFYSGADLDLGIVADVGAAVEALDDALGGRGFRTADGVWFDTLAQARDRNEARLRQHFDPRAVPIHPPRVAEELRRILPRDASIVAEGEITMAVARTMIPSFGMRTRLNAGTTGCMGTGVPYAIGAKLARPKAASVLVCGDYAFGAAFNDIETAQRVGANVRLRGPRQRGRDRTPHGATQLRRRPDRRRDAARAVREDRGDGGRACRSGGPARADPPGPRTGARGRRAGGGARAGRPGVGARRRRRVPGLRAPSAQTALGDFPRLRAALS